jgi:hypothetical protein
MELSLEILNILSLILPGLIAIKLYETISTCDENPLYEQVIFALIYSDCSETAVFLQKS